MRGGYTLHPHPTPKRLDYLRAVNEAGIYEPRHGIVANHCLTLGWVESVLRLPGGLIVRWRDKPFETPGEWIGQRLTDEGRAILASNPVTS